MSIDNASIGARLQSARRALGLTQTDVGGRMGMVTSTVSAIEAGKRAVTGSELHAFAQLFGRPLSYFLDERTTAAPEGFRFLFRAVADTLVDRAPLVALEQLAADYDLLEEIVGVPPLPIPADYAPFGLRTDHDAETLAEMERARLGLGDAPIGDLGDLLDGIVGVRVFLMPVQEQNWSSVSVKGHGGRPCIVVNSKEPGYRRTYDIAHEYGHVLAHLGRPGGPTAHIDRADDAPRHSPDERFADAFASAFLMPRRAVQAQLERMLRANSGRFTDFDLVHLAMQFGVSGQAMSLRLVSLRRITRDQHREYWKTRTFATIAGMLGYTIDDPDGFWERPAILPSRFRYLALKAYEEDLISLAKLAELLREDYYDLRARMRETVGVAGD